MVWSRGWSGDERGGQDMLGGTGDEMDGGRSRAMSVEYLDKGLAI